METVERKGNDEIISDLRYGGLFFDVNKSSIDAFFGICFGKAYDPLLNSLTHDDIVIDAGANVGVFSVLASRKARKVYSVEPEPSNFALLLWNIKKNGIQNVVPVRAALSDKKRDWFLKRSRRDGAFGKSRYPG